MSDRKDASKTPSYPWLLFILSPASKALCGTAGEDGKRRGREGRAPSLTSPLLDAWLKYLARCIKDGNCFKRELKTTRQAWGRWFQGANPKQQTGRLPMRPTKENKNQERNVCQLTGLPSMPGGPRSPRSPGKPWGAVRGGSKREKEKDGEGGKPFGYKVGQCNGYAGGKYETLKSCLFSLKSKKLSREGKVPVYHLLLIIFTFTFYL